MTQKIANRPTDAAKPTDAKAPHLSRISIAGIAILGIALYLLIRLLLPAKTAQPGVLPMDVPLLAVLVVGGVPLVIGLAAKALHREFGSDLLAGLSIVTSVLLHEYLAGAIVVLMLSGGEALEDYATRNASGVLHALANRMPTIAQRREGERLVETPVEEITAGETLVVLPHTLCPVDGTVIEGYGAMDESYLTGEPYTVSKAPGSAVLSGAINGDAVLTIRCEKPASDSRYARIMQVMRDSEQRRPLMRRLGDQLGAWYTPVAVGIALLSWGLANDPHRFLAVLVVATPCPLLIAIPVAIIGSISLAARRGIVIKDPAALEKISTCRIAIFDKTGTLTYGRPKLTEILTAPGFDELTALSLTASLERYSRHPLSGAIVEAAHDQGVPLPAVSEVRELPGDGLRAVVDGKAVHITGRGKLTTNYPDLIMQLPPVTGGMECLLVVNGRYAATLRFRDEPRPEGAHFIQHLSHKHQFQHVLLVSGDRESEVRNLADQVGITEVFAGQSPEQKLRLVNESIASAPTVFLGDGINDAPALAAATVGIAFGSNSEITTEAADAVILDSSLGKADVLLHIGRRMRVIALQSAVGGMALSILGMLLAATGHLPPVTGAISQEVIDVLAVLNALRAAVPLATLTDY